MTIVVTPACQQVLFAAYFKLSLLSLCPEEIDSALPYIVRSRRSSLPYFFCWNRPFLPEYFVLLSVLGTLGICPFCSFLLSLNECNK